MNKKGWLAEARALRYLRSKGLLFVTRNYTCRVGEIDLIMRDGTTLVFVEVRARSSDRYGGAAASITLAKQKKIVRAAELYLATTADLSDMPCRFDVIAIEGRHISWLQHAFEC